MANNAHNSKLDETIKQTLSNYEAPNSVADWEQMERMLDAAPQSSSFKHMLMPVFEWLTVLKSNSFKRLFSPYVLIGLVLACGAYFLFHVLSSTKINEKTIVPASQPPPAPAGPRILNPVLPSNAGIPNVIKSDSTVLEPQPPDNTEAAADENRAKSDEAATLKAEKDMKKEAEAEKIKKEKKEKLKKEDKNKLDKQSHLFQEKHDSSVLIGTHIGEIIPNYRSPSDSLQKLNNQNIQPRDSLQAPN